MLKPGMMLGDRYEIIELVGSGGMSEVYKAKDHKLNRYVAVKVLKREFSDDRNFVSKFRVEAQSAAGLSHPNIVNVYDVGEDEGIYYIVMEFVEGITLKEYIMDHGRLSAEQALDFALQIASGIEVAHQNHTIHRDIKPQNIIVSKNGTLKVTDFGIARAATSNTVASNAMGSVHYISPEQARGGYSDEKSDIYSLGITMYEMVTGRVPFEGDNNVTVALKHIQEEMIPPREYYPDIPASLEKVILKCTQKKPERRYLTASALIADLRRVATNPNGDFVVMGTNTSNNAPTVMMSQAELSSIRESAGKKAYDDTDTMTGYEEPGQSVADTGKYQEAPAGEEQPEKPRYQEPVRTQKPEGRTEAAVSAGRAVTESSRYQGVDDDFDPDDDDYKYDYGDSDDGDNETGDITDEDIDDIDPKLQKVVMIGGIVAAVIIAMFIMLFIGKAAGWFKFGSNKNTEDKNNGAIEMTVNVVGKKQQDAEKELTDAEIPYEIEKKNDDTIDADIVISQSYEKGDMIPADTKVKIVVSAGKAEVPVPNVVGFEVAQADETIKAAGFQVTHSYEYSADVEKDHVIRQDPSGDQKAADGSTVTVVVSNGPEMKEAEVPDLRNKTQQEAEAELTNHNLKLGNVTEEYSATVEAGRVISQSTSYGTKVLEGSSVDITISKGPEPTTEATTATKTYTATFSGSISFVGAGDSTNSYNVTVVYVIGDTSRTIASGSISAQNKTLTIPAGSTLTGLPNTGTLQILYNGVPTKPEDVSESVNVQVAEE